MFEELRELLRAQPFQPFRVNMNDGRSFVVRHPEFMAIARTSVAISAPRDGREADHHVICYVRNIASLESPIEPETTSQSA